MSMFDRLAKAIHAEDPIALATRLDGARAGAKMLVDARGVEGDLGTPGLNAAVVTEARALLQLAQTSLRSFGEDGEPVGDEVRIFVQTFAPKPDMYVFGAIDFSRAMASIGKFMGVSRDRHRRAPRLRNQSPHSRRRRNRRCVAR